MYKVLKPLPGYGYVGGEVTKHIAEVDVPRFLAHKHIEIVEATKSDPTPEAEKKPSKKGRKP